MGFVIEVVEVGEIWVGLCEGGEFFVVEQFGFFVGVVQQYYFVVVCGEQFGQLWQYGLVGGDVGVGGYQQVVWQCVVVLQVEMIVGIVGFYCVVVFQVVQQCCCGVVFYVVYCNFDLLYW